MYIHAPCNHLNEGFTTPSIHSLWGSRMPKEIICFPDTSDKFHGLSNFISHQTTHHHPIEALHVVSGCTSRCCIILILAAHGSHCSQVKRRSWKSTKVLPMIAPQGRCQPPRVLPGMEVNRGLFTAETKLHSHWWRRTMTLLQPS
jgi:hypothetical protein